MKISVVRGWGALMVILRRQGGDSGASYLARPQWLIIVARFTAIACTHSDDVAVFINIGFRFKVMATSGGLTATRGGEGPAFCKKISRSHRRRALLIN